MARWLIPLLAALIGGGAIYLLSAPGGPAGPLPDAPDQLILYSLDGEPRFGEDGKPIEDPRATEELYYFPVLGKVEVTDRQQVRQILGAIRRAIRNPPTALACFWPRHMVRVVKGGETIDMVICFHCHLYRVYREGRSETETSATLSPDAEPLFDKILTDAGVPLAKKAHER